MRQHRPVHRHRGFRYRARRLWRLLRRLRFRLSRPLPIPQPVPLRLLPPTRWRAVIRHATSARRAASMLLPTAERTPRRRQMQIPRIRQEVDAALRAAHPVPPHLGMRPQRRPQRGIVLQGRGPRRRRPIPAGTEYKVPLKFYGVKAKVRLILLIVFCMAPSYPLGSTLSRGYDGVSSSRQTPTAYCLETRSPPAPGR